MFSKSKEVQMEYENARDFWSILMDISTDNLEDCRGSKSEWGISEGKKYRILNLTNGLEKPLGEWNSISIECVSNDIKVWVNSDLVNYGPEARALSSQISIQVGGAEVEFKKNKIRPNG
jgi:hypothetical protein